jgi:hypothetical protein
MSDSDAESVSRTNTVDFKEAVKEWLSIFNQQAEIRKANTVLNKRKKHLSDVIITFMKSNDKEICNLGESGVLEVRTKKSAVPLKKEYVENLLSAYFKNDSAAAKEATTYLWENRQIKETTSLKRSNKL